MPTAADVAHLLRRTGFGASRVEIDALISLDRVDLVDHVLATSANPSDAMPAAVTDPHVSGWNQWCALLWWWLDRMATTPCPIVEKMTFFWHGHFTSAKDKVGDLSLLHQQNRLYRQHCLGDLRAFVHAMVVDPAMLLYLDNVSSVASAPNLNFARELMELFLLGPGNYTEADILASARAWTGHSIDEHLHYRFYPERHDGGSKTFLGITGNLDGPDIVDAIFDDPRTRAVMARFIATKLWQYFVSMTPPADAIDTVASALVSSGFSIAASVRALLLRDEFWSPDARHGLVRSPVDWLVAFMRATGLRSDSIHPEWSMAAMGQEPFNPPNVAGWAPSASASSPALAGGKVNLLGHAIWMLTGGGSDTGFLTGEVSGSPELAQAAVLDAYGLVDPSAHTTAQLHEWLTQEWAAQADPNARRVNLVLLSALMPDVQVA